jgi:hypothetical protein
VLIYLIVPIEEISVPLLLKPVCLNANYTMVVSFECFVCIFEAHLLYPIIGYCQHSKFFRTSKPYYKLSKLRTGISLILFVVLILPVLSYFSCINATCQSQNPLCLTHIVDLIYSIASLLMGLAFFRNVHIFLQELNQWVTMFELWKSYQFPRKNLMSIREVKKIKIRRITSMVSLMIANLVNSVVYWLFPYDILPWNVGRKVMVLGWRNVHSIGVFFSTEKTILVGNILTSIKKSLKFTFDSRLGSRGKVAKLSSVEHILKKYNDLLLDINANMGLVSRYMSSTFILWNVASTISLICNIYILIRYLDYNFYALILTQLRTLLTITEICVFYFATDINLQQKVSIN